MARILIIEDDEEMRSLLQDFLGDEGYKTDAASSGSEAFRKLAEGTFDLVITDVRMGDKDGMEVLKAFKKIAPETTVIMITAFANLDAAIEALRGDVHDFFPKPVKIKELKASIARAMEKSAA